MIERYQTLCITAVQAASLELPLSCRTGGRNTQSLCFSLSLSVLSLSCTVTVKQQAISGNHRLTRGEKMRYKYVKWLQCQIVGGVVFFKEKPLMGI